jgi:hypothetical protein
MSDTLGRYAPGNYSCKCSACGKEFTGDKRATTCLQCAGKEQFNAGIEQAAKIVATTDWFPAVDDKDKYRAMDVTVIVDKIRKEIK